MTAEGFDSSSLRNSQDRHLRLSLLHFDGGFRFPATDGPVAGIVDPPDSAAAVLDDPAAVPVDPVAVLDDPAAVLLGTAAVGEELA